MGKADAITTLEKLISRLDACDKRSNCYNDTLRSVKLSPQELEKYVYFRPHRYTRNLIYRTLDYELATQCWEPGQGNEIQDHNGQESWMVVVEGELTEQRYSLATLHGRLQPVGHTRLQQGYISYMHDNIGLQRIVNLGTTRAISFHLYVMPFAEYHTYEEATGLAERVYSRYDTHGGVILR